MSKYALIVSYLMTRPRSDKRNSYYDKAIFFDTSASMDNRSYQKLLSIQASMNATDSSQVKYNLLFNNCYDVWQNVFEAGTGVRTPIDFDPRPNASFDAISRMQSDIPRNIYDRMFNETVDYNFHSNIQLLDPNSYSIMRY